jgi:hypothetical protein
LELREIMKFYEAADKCVFFRSLVSSENDSERNSKVFSLPKMTQKRIPRFFLFPKWFGTDFKVFLIQKWFRTEFQGFFSSEKWFGTEFRGFFLPRKGTEQNYEGFSLPKNGSEQNFLVFLFHKTGGITTQLPSVPSCSVFCGIIFLSENGNPNCLAVEHLHIRVQ